MENKEFYNHDFIVNQTHILDMLRYGAFYVHILEEIFRIGEQCIDTGNKVILQQEYTNAKPDIIAIYDTKESLQE